MSRVVHFEFLSADPHAAVAFYKAVFGWQINDWGGSEQAYFLCSTGRQGTPGIDGAITGAHFPQATVVTMSVDSLQATIEAVEAAGGKLVQGPNTIPNVGIHAYFTDPTGVMFGALQGVEGAGQKD